MGTVSLTRDEGSVSLTDLVRRIEHCEWMLGIRKDTPESDNGPSSPAEGYAGKERSAKMSDGARQAEQTGLLVSSINRKNRELWGLK